MSQIVHVFPNTDLRSGHDGLRKLALRNKRNPAQLDKGHFLFFINRAQTAFKLMGSNELLVYYRSVGKRMIDINAVKFIPSCFHKDGSFDYNIAVRHSLKELMGKRFGPGAENA